MTARSRRALTLGLALTLGGLGLGAAPALATTVNIGESQGFPSSLSIFDLDGNADVVSVSISGPAIVITDTGPGGITPGTDCAALNPTAVSCPLDPPDPVPPDPPYEPIGTVFFSASLGDDSFSTTAPISVQVDGGGGTDTLNGSTDDDGLGGGPGNDQVNGGEGNDNLGDGGTFSSSGGTDVLNGGPGDDFTEYSRASAVEVSFDDVANDGFPGEGDNLVDMEGVSSGQGNDVITGNGETNFLFAGDGNDTVRGLGGNDSVDGGDGDDVVDGGAATDQVSCGFGEDTALLDALDDVGVDCERTGAAADVDSIRANGKGIAKLPVSCGAQEVTACTGKVVLELNGKKIAKGKFKVPAGKTKGAKVKLSKKGRKALKRSGGEALVRALIATDYGVGESVNEDTLLLEQSGKKGGPGKGGKGK
jgi:Ca2+-binding RTX toxin-like protein